MKKRRFTWLDGLICGVVLLAIVAGAVLFFGRGEEPAAGAMKTYEITLRCTQATNDPYDYYKVGDTMYFQNRTDELGTIKDLKLVDKVHEVFDKEQGCYVELVDQERKQIEMTVEVQGSLEKGEFTVKDEVLYIGMVFYPQNDTTRSVMTVWDIEEVQK